MQYVTGFSAVVDLLRPVLVSASANPQNSSELPTLFGSFWLVDKTRVHLAWPAAHDVKSETLFEVIKHLIYGTVCYINIFTNLSLLGVEMYPPPKLSCESRHLAWASCLCQSFLSCTRCHKKSVGLLMWLVGCTLWLTPGFVERHSRCNIAHP